jgi:hypothetical protein
MRLVTLSAFSLLSLFTRAESAENFTIDHYLKLNDVSEISVSPEGDYIAYTISGRDLEKDEQRHAVWMVRRHRSAR